MKIGLVRRGYSDTGGAESYLKRFAAALVEAGHSCVLFTGAGWKGAWPFGEVCAVPGGSPRAFAGALAALDPSARCDTVFSLERVWNCDCYRAGDGVHRAWLERRSRFEPGWKTWFRAAQPKHRALLELETALFRAGGAPAVIANSNMVKEEIIRHFGGNPGRIHVIYNGVATPPRRPAARAEARRLLGLEEGTLAVLFAGSGWERKGLAFAIEGIRAAASKPLLLVAGRGDPGRFSGAERTRFLGPVQDMESVLAASDVFLLPTIYDPFSNACLEALAAGLPVITTEANGFSEIIRSGVEGEILADPSDASAIARAVDGWSDPKRRGEIRPRLAQLASRFTVEANLRATLEVLGV